MSCHPTQFASKTRVGTTGQRPQMLSSRSTQFASKTGVGTTGLFRCSNVTGANSSPLITPRLQVRYEPLVPALVWVGARVNPRIALTRYCFTSKLYCGSPSFFLLPPPPLAKPTISQYYRTLIAQYTPPPPPRVNRPQQRRCFELTRYIYIRDLCMYQLHNVPPPAAAAPVAMEEEVSPHDN